MHKFPHDDGVHLGMRRSHVSGSLYKGCFYGFLIKASLLAAVLIVIWSVHKFNW